MSSLAYRDFRIGFLSVFHTLHEGWIAQNQIEDWMPEWMNRMDIQLTYSKNGRTWHRAGNREPILECGPRGSHDSGNVYPSHAPFVRGDEIWVYHSCSNELHGEGTRYGEESRRGINLAKIEKDRPGLSEDGGAGGRDHGPAEYRAQCIVDQRRCDRRVTASGDSRSV